MKVQIINGTAAGFQAKLDEIIAIYGDRPQLRHPEDAYLAHIPGVKGGFLFSKYQPPHHDKAQILLAAFEKADRRQGYGKAIVKKFEKFISKHDCALTTVELDMMGSNEAPWQAMGFTYKDKINLSPVLLKAPLSELFPDIQRTEGGLSIDQLLKMGVLDIEAEEELRKIWGIEK